jgi:hypothetical protein
VDQVNGARRLVDSINVEEITIGTESPESGSTAIPGYGMRQ